MSDHQRPPVRRLIAAQAAGLLLLAACAGGGGAGTASVGGGPTGAPGSTAYVGPAASGPVHGHVGDKLQWSDAGGTPFAATVVDVVDPATSIDSNSGSVPAGQHWVGIEIIVSDPQGNPAEDAAATDAVGSDGKPYGNPASGTAGYRLRGFDGCTAVDGAEGGHDATYCSGFLVTDGITLVSVGYGVEGVNDGGPDDATWSVP